MANLTAIFGTVLLIELAMNCSNSKISVSTIKKSNLAKVAFLLGGPVCCTLSNVRVCQAMFFCCSARCLHQRYPISISTSSKTGNYFLFHHLALSLLEVPRTTPMPPDLHGLDALIAGVSFQKSGPILRKVGKTSGTQGVINTKALLYISIMISMGFFCT
jgi:hypothetical protein